jgi:hypothetical protein
VEAGVAQDAGVVDEDVDAPEASSAHWTILSPSSTES